MVFTNSQAETWRPSEEALLWGSRKVTEAAAFHQDGGRCTAPRPEHHVDECWLFAIPLLPYSLGDLLPSLGGHSTHAHSLLHGWLGFRGDNPPWTKRSLWSPGAEDEARGPQGWVLYPQQTHPSWPWRSPWVSTGTCKPQTRSSPAAPALWAQMEALQEHSTISGWPARAAVACPSRDEAQPFAASPGTGAAPKENQQQPWLPAPRGFVGRTNLSSTTLDLLHLGNIRNLEGLFLGSEEL